MSGRRVWRALALGALALGSCTAPRTAVVVVVRTDLAVPDEISSVRVEVGDGGCATASCIRDFAVAVPAAFPFSFTIEPATAGVDTFALTATGRDPGGRGVVVRRASGAFSLGRTVRLVIDLTSACRGVSCADGSTCAAGICRAVTVEPSELVEVLPGEELQSLSDAGPPVDASLDAPPFDAPSDAAGRTVGSCADLSDLEPSGPYTVDPDGPGGADPFEAWCENDLDGGGWTLLLKIDPSATSGVLSYDDRRWTGTSGDAATGADESLGNAIYRPYWVLPVDELRFATPVGSAVVTIAGPAASLRSRMDTPAEFVAPVDLTALVPVGLGGGLSCSRSGTVLGLPLDAPELRVRVGWVGSTASDCGTPTFFLGAGASFATSRANCDSSTVASGGARVCGGGRHSAAQPLRIYGRARP